MLTDPGAPVPEDLGDLEALQGVAKFAVRVKCATLAWHTLADGIEQHEKGDGAVRKDMSVIPVKRLNHAVLYVRDLDPAVTSTRAAFGFEEIAREGGQMAFLRAAGSTNHHDLGLLAVGPDAPAPAARRDRPLPPRLGSADDRGSCGGLGPVSPNLGALTGMSDHGATKSLYGADPDGNEFELMWMVPRDQWGQYDQRAVIQPLDLQGEVARRGG